MDREQASAAGRKERLQAHLREVARERDPDSAPAGHHRKRAYDSLLEEALKTERRTILRLRNERVINDAVLRRIQRDLDLAEGRLKRDTD